MTRIKFWAVVPATTLRPYMGYQLGIDLGTTYTAAAVAVDGRVEPLALGTRSAVLPTVVFARPDRDGADGELLVGEAAETRGVTEPARLAREFKRRLGDPAPLVLGGVPYPAEALMGAVLAHVHRVATERMGGEPDHVVITHPATYSSYRIDLLRDAARRAGFATAEFLTEPQAAATHYASLGRVTTGDVIAVYDLGGGTFDAAIVRDTGGGFELLGEPHGLERLGGIDFDIAVVEHVNDAMGGQLASLPDDDPAVRAGLARLRADARHAKEVLSADTDTTIPLVVPGVVGEVRLTRGELEQLVVPRIRESIDVLRRALASSGLRPDDLAAVLLVGGSSRIPAVRDMVMRALEVRVTADIDPELAVALGAARHAARHAVAPASAASPPPLPPPTAATVAAGPRRNLRLIAVGVGVVALVVVAAFLATRDSGGGGAAPDTTAPGTAVVDTTPPDTGPVAEGCALFMQLVADPQTPIEDIRAEGAEGCDLRGADLRERGLSGVVFDGAILDGALFDDSELTGATFQKASMQGVSFQRATVSEADFEGADLTGATFVQSTANDANFNNATLRGATFVDTACRECRFDGAVLQGADMAGTDLSGAQIVNADMASVGIDRVTIDTSSVLGPAPGDVVVLNATPTAGLAGTVAETLAGLGYATRVANHTGQSTVTQVSCRGDFFGSEMRKLALAIDNLFFADEEEVDFNDLVLDQSVVDDESVACVVIVGSDLVIP